MSCFYIDVCLKKIPKNIGKQNIKTKKINKITDKNNLTKLQYIEIIFCNTDFILTQIIF